MNLKSQLSAALRDCFDALMWLPKQNLNKREEIKNEKLIKCLLVCDLHVLTEKKNHVQKKVICVKVRGWQETALLLFGKLLSVTVKMHHEVMQTSSD